MTDRIDAITSRELLEKFGLPASPGSRLEIRALLIEATARERQGLELGDDVLRLLCVQLFSIGAVEDSLLIWDAKQSSFDAGVGIVDVQFLCGAGLEETKSYLAQSQDPAARAAERMSDVPAIDVRERITHRVTNRDK